MYSVFLSSYTNTRESLGELEKAVDTLACGSRSHSISRRAPKLPLADSQRGAAELTIARRKRGRVV